MHDLGIVIVTYNSQAEIGPCLDAALRIPQARIVVVDNASHDGTRTEVERRGVALLANAENRGFAAAVNQGVRAIGAEYVLLLNPDAMVEGGVEDLVRCCSRSNVGAAGGKLVDLEGRPQTGFCVRRFPSAVTLAFEALLLNRLWPRNPINRRYRCLDVDLSMPARVEQPAGAFFLFRHETWVRLGGFDEGFYPLWFEDVDFCKRARQAGLEIWYTPGAVAKHTGGHSVSGLPLEVRELYWYRSVIRYAAKHFPSWQGRLLSLAVILGSVIRMLYGMAAGRSRGVLTAYSRVIRLAGRCIWFGPRVTLSFHVP